MESASNNKGGQERSRSLLNPTVEYMYMEAINQLCMEYLSVIPDEILQVTTSHQGVHNMLP